MYIAYVLYYFTHFPRILNNPTTQPVQGETEDVMFSEKLLKIFPESYLTMLSDTNGTIGDPVVLKQLGGWKVRDAIQSLRTREKQHASNIQFLSRRLNIILGKSLTDLAFQADYGIEPMNLEAALGEAFSNDGWLQTFQHVEANTTFVRCSSCEHVASLGREVSCIWLQHIIKDQSAPYDSLCKLR